jgi:hypothetical protein
MDSLSVGPGGGKVLHSVKLVMNSDRGGGIRRRSPADQERRQELANKEHRERYRPDQDQCPERGAWTQEIVGCSRLRRI